MLTPKIKIEPALYEKLTQAAAAAGYSATEEFIMHVLEKAVADQGRSESEEAIKKRLQGLGYLD